MTTTEHSLLEDNLDSYDETGGMYAMNLPCVLLVDNDTLPQDCHKALKDEGYQLRTMECSDCDEQFLEKVKDIKPALILLSAHLSDVDSFSLCQRLKCDQATDTIPVIFIGQTADTQLLVKSLDHGGSDFFPVQSPVTELMARVQSALRTKHLLNQSDALASQLREMNTELYERNLQVEKELHVTRQLQQSLLPKVLPDAPKPASAESSSTPSEEGMGDISFAKCHYRDEKIRISGVYLPCDALGGDLYDIIRFNEDSLGVTIADVSGHGVPAAFVTAIYKAAFYRATLTYESAGDVMFHLNNELYHIVKTGEYVTSLYCRLLEGGKVMEYSGAGHPYPLFYHAADQSLERLKENGTPLVWVKDMEYPNVQVSLEPGDRILLFTDGISEIKNAQREMFGEEALEALFMSLIQEHPDRILDKLIEALSNFTQGHPLDDDMSLVLIEVLP